MKVALICDWFHPRVGGLELHVSDLAARLTAANHDVVVITPTPGHTRVDGIRVIRIDARRAPRFGFLITPAGVRAIGDALVAERADVAHCHVSIVSPAALGGARQAERRDVPLVLTFHSIVPNTPVLAHAARYALGTSRWHACFSAVSERVAREVAPIAGTRPMSILPNGVDALFWRRLGDRPSTPTIELISVMRLNAKKRPFVLLGMMKRLQSLLPPTQRVRLRIVGDGPQRERLQRAIVAQRFEESIELLGHRTRLEIRDLLWASDVFVLPTLRESFGLAALEARCAGLPIVAMAKSGVGETVLHDREGLLATSDAELATHVAALVTDHGRRRRIAAHNRTTPAPFDWPAVVSLHTALYREAMALRDSV